MFRILRCGAVRCGAGFGFWFSYGAERLQPVKTAPHRTRTVANYLILKTLRPSHGFHFSESRTGRFGVMIYSLEPYGAAPFFGRVKSYRATITETKDRISGGR